MTHPMTHLEMISNLTKEEQTVLEAVGLSRLIQSFLRRTEHDRDIAKDVMQNFPEAGICVHCNGWHYPDGNGEDWKLYFDPAEDTDESDYILPLEANAIGNDSYIVTLDMVVNALPIFRSLLDDKTYHFYGANQDDHESWDAIVYDGIIQICLFGRVILG